MKRLLTYLTFLVLASHFIAAQEADERFGKNRVQYKDFDWKSLNTAHFTVYYYSGGNEIAHNAARYAEMDFKYLTNALGYIPRSRLTLIVYNSIGDLQQSNMGFRSENYLGGETNFVKSRIEIAFPGTQVGFREELKYKISKMMLNYIMFGGNLKEVVQSNYMMNLPPWFINGASSYLAGKNLSDVYDFMYHHINKHNPDPSKLTGRDAELAGHAFFLYCAEKYGESIVPNLVNLTRITHDEQVSIITTLNVPYRATINEWVRHYENIFGNRTIPVKERNHIFDWHKFELKHLVVNPDTSLIAYSYHAQGKQKIIIKDTATGKRKQLYVNHFKVIDQATQDETPLIRWKSKTELSYITYKKGQPYFVTYDMKKGRTVKKKFDYLDQILSFDHSPLNDDEIVVSAVQKGQSDIFVYNFKINHASRETKDLYDDLNPRYLPNSNKIIFSSNRHIDTLMLDPGKFDQIEDSFDLFIFTPGNLVLDRVTNSSVSEKLAHPISESRFLALANDGYQTNLYLIDTNEYLAHQVLDYTPSVVDFSVDEDEIYTIQRAKREAKEFVFRKNLDTSFNSYNTHNEALQLSNQDAEQLEFEEALNHLLTLDLDQIQFDSSKVDTTNDLLSMLRASEKIDVSEINIYGPNKYRLMMGLDNFVSSAILDPLRGMSLLFDANMSELFGNHQFSGDFTLASDLRSNIVTAEYEYLEKRTDYSILVYREDLRIPVVAHYGLTKLEGKAALPFNQVSRVYGAANYTTTGIASLQSLLQDNIYNNYAGYDFGFVFDNSSIYGLNMMRGTRAKAYLRYNYDIGDGYNNFGEFRTDIRHYQKIVDDVTFAIRGSYGKYFGGGAKNYSLGGMDNWFLFQTDGIGDDPLQYDYVNEDMLFLDFITGLRGFNYNKLYGNQHLLFNAELRVPIARLVKNSPIQSKFYKNLQFLTFYDLGTAWNTGNIFTKANDRTTTTIDSHPFDATITKYTSPFLGSYGFGMRTMMLGYYMKMDLAWGVENYNINRPKFYLTIGYDF